jgi:tripartite-type tricarboxylate transporter receptor subunit TctC
MMMTRRRQFLRLTGAGFAFAALPRLASALVYPTGPLRLITPFGPGTSADIVARLAGQWLAERLGQPVIIDNRPGAGGTMGTDIATRAAPDGYTLLWVSTANAINATLYEHLQHDFIRDIEPIAGFMQVPNVMEVNMAAPVTTVPEFIAYAQANPGKINYASNGNGTTPHVAGELFKMLAGVDLLRVPYRGSPEALTDLISGRVQVMFDVLPSSIAHIKARALRPLAVTTVTRSEALPGVPTLNEFVPGYEASTWMGIGAPTGIPREIVHRLNTELQMALVDPTMRGNLASLGASPLPGSSAEFKSFVAAETEKWARVVRFSGAHAE